jgi:predicted HD phosphohydrolase
MKNLHAALDRPDWSYLEKTRLDDFTAEDWRLMAPQRRAFYADHQADHVLAMMALEKDHNSFGYLLNNYQHGLQTATMMLQAGHDEETVVVALIHDIGFLSCPETHGNFAAALLSSHISERNRWMLTQHQVFQQIHLKGYPGIDMHAREKWRGHPHFEWTAEFVEKFDQVAIDPRQEIMPIEAFVPLVHRVFARIKTDDGRGEMEK